MLPTDVSPESSYYSTLVTPDHLSWFWSLIKSRGTAREVFVPVLIQELVNPCFLQ